MSNFLTKIHVNKVFHLGGFDIELDPQEKKHLIITGKNGSGKTSLLNRLVDFLQIIKSDSNLRFLALKDEVEHWNKQVQDAKANNNPTALHHNEIELRNTLNQVDAVFGAVEMCFNDIYKLSKKVQSQDFVLAYYSATRKTNVIIPKSPEKPDLRPLVDIKASKIEEFLKFLVDLKAQEAFARNEKQNQAADEIRDWFIGFTYLLKDIFENDKLNLEFNFKDYSFVIDLGGRKFGFNHLSDGYSAIIDIVADLIIKMQDQNSLTHVYKKDGIVLIDEVQTHLHLRLQRLILPMLTKIFPNIQFIITTHSPFVLSSLKDAVAYDLERRIRVEDLTEYSYEALAEGYFNVETEPGFLHTKIEKFKTLSEMPYKDSSDIAAYQSLDKELASMKDDPLAPENVKIQYLKIKLNEKNLA